MLSRRLSGAVLAVSLPLLLSAVVTVAVADAVGGATKGRIPDAAFVGTTVDLNQVPDYVSVSDQGGNVVGYVSKEVISNPTLGAIDKQGRPAATSWTVLGEDLKTVVGYVVPDKGFVPIGIDPATVSPIPYKVAPAP